MFFLDYDCLVIVAGLKVCSLLEWVADMYLAILLAQLHAAFYLLDNLTLLCSTPVLYRISLCTCSRSLYTFHSELGVVVLVPLLQRLMAT